MNIDQFRRLAQPPKWALRQITGGRLKGKTDIKPAWRIQAMTEVYGLCGVGWRYEVAKQWTEQGSDGQIMAFVDVNLYIRLEDNATWSEPIPGTGGNMLVEKESKGLYSNDEAFKMATTDALSSAMRLIGMAADIYAGQWDGSKYHGMTEPKPKKKEIPPLTEEEKGKVERALEGIRNAKDREELQMIGEGFVNHSPAVKAELSQPWAARNAELKKKEMEPQDGNS